MEAELKTLKESHQAELTRISREHEDKVLFLLRQMPKAEVSYLCLEIFVKGMKIWSIFQECFSYLKTCH